MTIDPNGTPATFKSGMDLISSVLNDLNSLGLEFLPKEGMIVVLHRRNDNKLATLGAIVEGDTESATGWHYVPWSEVPSLMQRDEWEDNPPFGTGS